MKKIIIEEQDITEVISLLEKTKARLQQIKTEAVEYRDNVVEQPIPIIEHDALCYIRRYEDLKRVVEGRERQFKIQWARQHFERFGVNENRVWGCIEAPVLPDTPEVPDIQSAPKGILWKPVAESRGGVPVLLTPSAWDQVDTVLLFAPDSEVSIRVSNLEKRGRTNSNRETYFFHGVRARNLPKNMILDIAQYGRYLVPDPTLRYE